MAWYSDHQLCLRRQSSEAPGVLPPEAPGSGLRGRQWLLRAWGSGHPELGSQGLGRLRKAPHPNREAGVFLCPSRPTPHHDPLSMSCDLPPGGTAVSNPDHLAVPPAALPRTSHSPVSMWFTEGRSPRSVTAPTVVVCNMEMGNENTCSPQSTGPGVPVQFLCLIGC